MKDRKQFLKGVLVGAVSMVLIGALASGIIFLKSNIYSTNSFVISESDSESLDVDSIGKNIELLEAMVDAGFILDYDKSLMEQGIYKGLIAALDDPYSEYFSPKEAAAYRNQMAGEYCGMGATISEDADSGNVTILKVYADSPAEKAGVKSGDVIIGIDNESTSDLSTDEIVALARGEEGTTFILNIIRDGERMDFEITRAQLQIPQVEYLANDEIGYISLNQFVGTAEEEMQAALEYMNNQGVEKLVIDLRNNLGGSLDVLVKISNYFLDKDEVIVKEVDKKGTEKIHTADGSKIFDGDIVILTNGYTASAAEAFTAALHDNDKATTVGTQTYGKGIVQENHTLKNGGILKLTTEYYYTPDNICIHKVGITPDYVLEYDASSKEDNQVAKAIELLK